MDAAQADILRFATNADVNLQSSVKFGDGSHLVVSLEPDGVVAIELIPVVGEGRRASFSGQVAVVISAVLARYGHRAVAVVEAVGQTKN